MSRHHRRASGLQYKKSLIVRLKYFFESAPEKKHLLPNIDSRPGRRGASTFHFYKATTPVFLALNIIGSRRIQEPFVGNRILLKNIFFGSRRLFLTLNSNWL